MSKTNGKQYSGDPVHQQLVADGLIVYDGFQWDLTEKGRRTAEKELDRYLFKPGLRVLICMRIAQDLGVTID
jgi:hypothetical protein